MGHYPLLLFFDFFEAHIHQAYKLVQMEQCHHILIGMYVGDLLLLRRILASSLPLKLRACTPQKNTLAQISTIGSSIIKPFIFMTSIFVQLHLSIKYRVQFNRKIEHKQHFCRFLIAFTEFVHMPQRIQLMLLMVILNTAMKQLSCFYSWYHQNWMNYVILDVLKDKGEMQTTMVC